MTPVQRNFPHVPPALVIEAVTHSIPVLITDEPLISRLDTDALRDLLEHVRLINEIDLGALQAHAHEDLINERPRPVKRKNPCPDLSRDRHAAFSHTLGPGPVLTHPDHDARVKLVERLHKVQGISWIVNPVTKIHVSPHLQRERYGARLARRETRGVLPCRDIVTRFRRPGAVHSTFLEDSLTGLARRLTDSLGIHLPTTPGSNTHTSPGGRLLLRQTCFTPLFSTRTHAVNIPR